MGLILIADLDNEIVMATPAGDIAVRVGMIQPGGKVKLWINAPRDVEIRRRPRGQYERIPDGNQKT